MHQRNQTRHLWLALSLTALMGCDGALPVTDTAPARRTPAEMDPDTARASSSTSEDAPTRSGSPDANRSPRATTPAGEIPSTNAAPSELSSRTRTTPTVAAPDASKARDQESKAQGHTVPDDATIATAANPERDSPARPMAPTEATTAAEDATSQPDIEPTETEAAAKTAQTAGAESGGGFWVYLFGLFLMAAVGAGAWLMLQPPWKRWRWYWALNSKTRALWLRYISKSKEKGAPAVPKVTSPPVASSPSTPPATPSARGRTRESEIETMIQKPPSTKSKTESAKHGTPLRARDTTTLNREEGGAEVVSEKTEQKARKRRKRNTEITLPIVTLANPNSTKKN